MVVSSGAQAVKIANGYKTCRPGMCLKYVRTWLGIGSQQPDAIGAWNAAKHRHVNGKHADAQKPPQGAPVFWSGGKHGHIALAVNNSNGRSTDTPTSGRVDTRPGDWWRQNWGGKYLGWTEDLNGVDIPYLRGASTGPPASHAWASKGNVWVESLVRGQQDSVSVSRLRYRLMQHQALPANLRPGYGTSDQKQGAGYGPDVEEAVKWWQRNVNKQGGRTDGKAMTNKQAGQLFGANYNVIPK